MLRVLYLGSGGGGCMKINGTNGGGALMIECENGIVIHKNAIISVNGEFCQDNTRVGCGSGGSIYLKAPKILNYGKLVQLVVLIKMVLMVLVLVVWAE